MVDFIVIESKSIYLHYAHKIDLRTLHTHIIPVGLMERRDASINDVPIKQSERRYFRNKDTGLVEYPHGHP